MAVILFSGGMNYMDTNTMSNNIQVFHNQEFGKLEVLMIDGKPYFPATECAKILGYSNTKDAIREQIPKIYAHIDGTLTVHVGVHIASSPSRI
jgi:prophage antirepressor-like protein